MSEAKKPHRVFLGADTAALFMGGLFVIPIIASALTSYRDAWIVWVIVVNMCMWIAPISVLINALLWKQLSRFQRICVVILLVFWVGIVFTGYLNQ